MVAGSGKKSSGLLALPPTQYFSVTQDLSGAPPTLATWAYQTISLTVDWEIPIDGDKVPKEKAAVQRPQSAPSLAHGDSRWGSAGTPRQPEPRRSDAHHSQGVRHGEGCTDES